MEHVSIPISVLATLIRSDERLKIILNEVKSTNYVSGDFVKRVCNVPTNIELPDSDVKKTEDTEQKEEAEGE